MERAGRGLPGRIREPYAGRREGGRSPSGDPSESTEASASESSAKLLARSERTLQQLCGIVPSLADSQVDGLPVNFAVSCLLIHGGNLA